MTLTFNIFKKKNIEFNLLPTNKNYLEQLNSIKKSSKDDYYGYYCCHLYGKEALEKYQKNPLQILKGDDAQFFSLCKSLNLNAEIKAFFDKEDYLHDREKIFVGNRFDKDIDTENFHINDDMNLDDSSKFYDEFLIDNYEAECLKQKIEWLNTKNKLNSYLFAQGSYYGNEYNVYSYYFSVIILIRK